MTEPRDESLIGVPAEFVEAVRLMRLRQMGGAPPRPIRVLEIISPSQEEIRVDAMLAEIGREG